MPAGCPEKRRSGVPRAAPGDTCDELACLCTPPSDGEGCLTRTPGFWCNRPLDTDFLLPIEVCGITLDNVDTETQGSAIEDLVFGRDHRIDNGRNGVDPAGLVYPDGIGPQNLQLVRQCTAARLNLAASRERSGAPPMRRHQNGKPPGIGWIPGGYMVAGGGFEPPTSGL